MYVNGTGIIATDVGCRSLKKIISIIKAQLCFGNFKFKSKLSFKHSYNSEMETQMFNLNREF